MTGRRAEPSDCPSVNGTIRQDGLVEEGSIMATGRTLTNPVTGERLVFVNIPDDRTQPLELEDHWPPDHRVAAHVHPGMDERWEVLAGRAAFRIGGQERTVSAGEVVEAPAGTVHMGWAAGDEPVVLKITIDPALLWPEFIRELFGLAGRELTDDSGMPPDGELTDLLRRYPREIAPPPGAD